jgi:hypothetical protein
MISLYESILSSTKSGRSNFVFTEFIKALNKINGITKLKRIVSQIHFPKGFVPDALYAEPCFEYLWTTEDETNKIMGILDDFFKIGYKTVRKKMTDFQEIPDFGIKRSKLDQKFYIVETLVFKLDKYFVCLKISTPTELNRDKRCQLIVALFNDDKRKSSANNEILNLLN